MTPLIGTLTLLAAVGLTGAARADDTPSPQAPTETTAPPSGSKDWSQTHLIPKPALQQQYNRTSAFLDEKLFEVDEQVSRLKTDGVLDRRSATTIRSALNNARVSMTRMAGGMQENEQVNGWTARMFAFELGMAADTLRKQAVEIEMNLDRATAGRDGQQEVRSMELDQQRELAQTLNETGILLRKTARAITENLQ